MLQAEGISDVVRIDWPDWLVLYEFFMLIVIITSATECNRGIYMFHWMLVAPQALTSVLPVEDSFSNKKMCTFSRIRAHQSTSETFKHKSVKEENKACFCQLIRNCGYGDE